MNLEVQPGDRVLFLAPPPLAVLETLSPRLDHGVAVCLAAHDSISASRRAALHLENVLFVEATAHEIPWQEGFFNWIVAPSGAELSPEIRRVLDPDGHFRTFDFPDPM